MTLYGALVYTAIRRNNLSFTYKIWVSPAAYENLYAEMRERGHASVKATIKELLLEANEQDMAHAIVLAKKREAMR